MMTRRNMHLLAIADPWGLEGLGDCHQDRGLGQIGKTYESGKAAGDAITSLMKAGDVNAVAKGADEGLQAAGGVVTGLTGAWGDASKFFISVGGSVDTPVIGYKGPNLPMWTSTDPSFVAGMSTNRTYVPKNFLMLVADEWLFATPSWQKFGFRPPEPGGVKGQVWNPFKGQWQGAGEPIVNPADIATKKDVATVKSPTATGAARLKLIQNSVNTLGGANPQYGFAVAFVQQVMAVKAGNYDTANQGYQAGAPFPGLISTIRVLATPKQYIKTALATNVMFTKGPLTGELLEHVRVGWLKDLKALVKSMPADKRPSNAGLLALATKDGTTDGPTIPTPTKISPAQAGIALLILGFIMRRFL